MTIAAAVRTAVARELGIGIENARSVAGGCISPAYQLECTDGTRLFLKTNADGPAGMLEQEALSLARIGATATVRVPRVIATTPEWLALEWLEPARGDDHGWRELGGELAHLHRCTPERAACYGWEAPNFIGSLPQANDCMHEWPAFWRERRLLPQLQRARTQLGGTTMTKFERLLDGLGERLAAAADDGPSLLHGDLWAGNVHFTTEGAAVIDPSSYYGHREVDLAMAALFGGFPQSFFDAYLAEWPLADGDALRRPIYQLYYLLVHVNLFGGGYVAQTRRTLDEALGTAR